MDNRLVLTVLFVMLSWISVGTYAQNTTAAPNVTTAAGNMTTAAGNNMTTAAGNMTTVAGNMTTAAGNNMTTAVATMTTAAGNMTTAAGNMTTAAGNMTTAAGNNMTTAVATMTTAAGNMTTAAGNMTTAAGNMTTVAGNMTTVPTAPTTTPATTAATTTPATTATTTTLAPPLVPNTTVDNLVAFITRTGCGTSKLCLDQPSGCTPGAAGGCSFCSLNQTSGQNFVVELSGESDGYVAVSVSTDATQGGNDQTYICANANGEVRFFSTLLNNGVLTVTVLSVNSVRGRVTGRNIQCTFAVTLPNSINRASSLSVAVVNGTFNSGTNTFGTPVSQIQTGVIDLANPSSNTTNLLAHGTTLQQSLTQALLIAVGVLSLTRL